jgi:hypothetical protein
MVVVTVVWRDVATVVESDVQWGIVLVGSWVSLMVSLLVEH